MLRYLLILASVSAVVFYQATGSTEKIAFLDVGQGDSILIQDSVTQILIDGGPGNTVLRRLGEEMPWHDRKVEIIILTHPQRDHIEGLLHVMQRYEIGLVIFPAYPHDSHLNQTWLKQIRQQKIPYRFARSGQKINAGDINIKILAPSNTEQFKSAVDADINNASTVTRIDFHNLSLLLTGDAEKRAEKILVENTPPQNLDVDILKAGHHGSNSSTHYPLIKAASPQAAVISVESDNKYGHPQKEVLERLGNIPIWRTDKQGSIKFVFLNERWHLKTNSKTQFLNETGNNKQ